MVKLALAWIIVLIQEQIQRLALYFKLKKISYVKMLKNVNKKFLCILLYISIVNNNYILGVFLAIIFYCFVHAGVSNTFLATTFPWLALTSTDRHVIQSTNS